MSVLVQVESDRIRRAQARRNPRCVVCGSENPSGLHLHFRADTSGARANWATTRDWESFQATIHGGIIATVLDESMSKAIIAQDWEALTAELKVRFRKRIAPGDELEVHGWVVRRKKRHIQAEAVITSDGEELAHAWGTFLALEDKKAVSDTRDVERSLR